MKTFLFFIKKFSISQSNFKCSGNINLEAIQKTRQLLSKKKKTLAYCRTGTRCITLWACAKASCKCPDEILENVREAGYNLDYLREFLIDLSPTS